MRKITLANAGFPIPAHYRYSPPECVEIHLSEGVAKVLVEILDISPDTNSWYPPEKILNQLNRSMEPWKSRMASEHLEDKDFLDLVVRLRLLSEYARKTQRFISYRRLEGKKNEYGPENDPNPYD